MKYTYLYSLSLAQFKNNLSSKGKLAKKAIAAMTAKTHEMTVTEKEFEKFEEDMYSLGFTVKVNDKYHMDGGVAYRTSDEWQKFMISKPEVV